MASSTLAGVLPVLRVPVAAVSGVKRSPVRGPARQPAPGTPCPTSHYPHHARATTHLRLLSQQHEPRRQPAASWRGQLRDRPRGPVLAPSHGWESARLAWCARAHQHTSHLPIWAALHTTGSG
jgi:hypothetical protein